MNPRNQPTATRPNPRGFTLLELVVGTAVMSVIMVALGSVMLIAGRALPQAQSATGAAVAAAGAAEQMASELRYALAINQRSATMIEFTVADRNSDGLPETIRYEWSGTAAAPLTRQYNGGTAVDALSDVREFSLSYDTETISEEIPQGNESAETLLVGYTASADYHDYTIKESYWCAEYFLPTLPADAVSWKVTRVKFYAKLAGGIGGQARVQLQLPTSGGLPSGVVRGEQILYESILPLLYLENELHYTTVSGLSPQQGLCMVFRWAADAEACKLLGRGKNVTATNVALSRSTSQGLTWSQLSGESLLFSVYGTVTTTGTPQIQNTCYLNAVQIQLRSGNDSGSFVQTAVRTLNRPEVIQ
jgi:prepilin-type N-terminal cleavage/methylation domain-containing protein